LSSREIQAKMLEELQKIREAVEPKPAPPPPAPPKGFREEFMAFLNKYGVIGLAIAFIIGGAAGRLVSALVTDLLMPIINFVVPEGDWRKLVYEVGTMKFQIGDFLGVLVDFLIIALVVFVLMKQLAKTGLK